MFKKIALTFSVLTILLGCCFPLIGFAKVQAESETAINQVVAVINNDVITQSSLNQQIQLIRSQLSRAHAPLPSDQKIRESVLQQMIDRKLQLQSASNAGIRISTFDLNTALNNIATENHLTLDHLYQSVQKDGWTIEGFKQEIQEEMIIEKLQRMELGPKIRITPEEIQDFLNSKNRDVSIKLYHLEDIFVSFPETATQSEVATAQKKAQHIFAQLTRDKDFKKIAMESARVDASIHVGDLSWRPLSELPTLFESYIVQMKKGMISNPIKTPNGFHIIKLVDNPKIMPQQKITREQAEKIIFQKKADEATKAFVENLRNQAYIKIL